MTRLEETLREVRACSICGDLPLGPRPIVRMTAAARLLIIGQAPGTRVHETGVPWNDPSGDRLRDWLGMDKDAFYDETRIAVMPMGFCYPGKQDKGGDKPPRKECAPHWHGTLRALLPDIRLTLLVGGYAQARYLGESAKKTVTETVRSWRDYAPDYFPTPHPSWRATIWLKKNPWFETDAIHDLRRRLDAVFS